MSRTFMIALGTAVLGIAACTDRGTPPAPITPARLVLADSVDHIDALAREPMVVEHPNGTLFVTGYWAPGPKLWQSTDRGAHWRPVDVGTAKDGAAGNSDVDLAVAPDGTLYFITMVFDRIKLEGTSVNIAVSHDTGTSWTWTRLANTRFDDRPWVDVAPDGTAHAIWNDGAGVAHSMSTDQGRTWTEGRREWYPMKDTTVTPVKWGMPAQPRWVEPLAWDSAGALYSFWAEGAGLTLARSIDQGATWTSWKVADAPATPYFPYLIARGRGQVAASWFTGTGDSLRANVAMIDVAPDSAAPRVTMAPAFRLESMGPVFAPTAPQSADPGGEYLAITFLKGGALGVAAPVQNLAANRLGFSWRRYDARR